MLERNDYVVFVENVSDLLSSSHDEWEWKQKRCVHIFVQHSLRKHVSVRVALRQTDNLSRRDWIWLQMPHDPQNYKTGLENGWMGVLMTRIFFLKYSW